MIVSKPTTAVQLMESVLDAQKARNDMTLAVLEKAQDITIQFGDASIDLIEKAGLQTNSRNFEALA
jgi:hypothetical protein